MFRVDIHKTLAAGSGSFCVRVAFEAPSRRVVIFGPSGSGKSLTLQLMAGLLQPQRGHVVINGKTLFDAAQKVDIPARKRRIGYVFQDYALFSHMSVRANIAFAVEPGPKKHRAERVDHLLARFELHNVADNLPSRISGGQRQRTALARALAMEPEVLFLDEPLAALDPLLRRRVREDLLAAIDRTGLPTVIISHDPEDADIFAQSLIVLDAGAVRHVADYPRERLRHPSAFAMLESLLPGHTPG